MASQYVEKMMNVVSHQTLRNKLRSLEYFCAYITDVLFTYPNSDVSINIVQNLTTLKKCLPNWRTSLKGKCNKEDIEKRLDDAVEQLTPQNIQNYLQSDHAAYAERVLHRCNDSAFAQPSTYDFLVARNHLLVLMCIRNAHRSGVLINFVTDDYDKRMVAEDGNIVITVCNHKTSSTHGAATICVSHEEGQLLAGYLNMRNCLLQNAPSIHVLCLLWSPYVIGQTVIFLPCDFFLLFLA